MIQTLRFNKIIKWVILAGDLMLLNAAFLIVWHLLDESTIGVTFAHSLTSLLVLLNFTYIFCTYSNGVILHERIVRPERIVLRAVRCTIFHALLFTTLVGLGDYGQLSATFFLYFYFLFGMVLIAYRLTFRHVIKMYRMRGGNIRTALFVGHGSHMVELFHQMTDDATSGFRVVGYFAEQPESYTSSSGSHSVDYLGSPSEVIDYLYSHQVDQLYCGLPATESPLILPLINYCENHFIQFYSVPNIRTWLKRAVHLEMMGNVPLLSIREEPLAAAENRFIKRLFDVVVSGLFLCTLFPIIYIVVGIAIKLSSPGPIFFRQKRTGKSGCEFWCYKFRSMRVNADSDRLQATKNDPRKTRLGNFLRKSNIDELPQFINVFLGDMSIVGPRPHMLKHTEQYSALIDKYMVRHLIKPGVTGWAQVNGYRGETRELWQMEGRVRYDVWYLEHWSFTLDLYIIYKTVKNVIQGEKEAY